MARRKLFSVTLLGDCDVQAFSVGGHGGSGKDTSNSGARVVHRASGAVGEGRESRSFFVNRKQAFIRMTETKTFKAWHRLETARRLGKPSVEELVEREMRPENLRVEVRDEKGRWVNADTQGHPPLTVEQKGSS